MISTIINQTSSIDWEQHIWSEIVDKLSPKQRQELLHRLAIQLQRESETRPGK